MKRLFTTVVLVVAALGAMAQGNQKIVFDDSDYSSLRATIPEFSYNGKVQMYLASRDDYESFKLLDDNFDVQREICPATETVSYTSSSKTLIPNNYIGWEVVQSYENVRSVYRPTDFPEGLEFYYYNEETGQKELMQISNTPTPSQAHYYVLYWGYQNYDYMDDIYKEETTGEGTFYYIHGMTVNDKDGNTIEYPIVWFWLKNDGEIVLVERYYEMFAVPGEGFSKEETKTDEETQTQKVYCLPSYFTDYDDNVHEDTYCSITQTLFNNDEKYEYVVPKMTEGLSSIYWTYNNYRDFYGYLYKYFPRLVKEYGLRTTGFDVVSEDGNVIQSVDFEGGFCGYYSSYSSEYNIIKINGKCYLTFDGYVLDDANNTRRDATLVYAVDRETSEIRKVMEHVGDVSVSPRVVDHREQVTVDLGDSRHSVRELQVVNAAGKTVERISVKDGQRSVVIPANKMSRGLNVVNAIGGKHSQSCKVMVK